MISERLQTDWNEECAMPSLHIAADTAARSNQKSYLWIIRLNYGLIILGSLFAVLASFVPQARNVTAIISAILLFLGTLISAMLKTFKLGKKWFQARAIAESVKTLAWRYMTGSNLFEIELSPKEADGNFCKKIMEILQNSHDLGHIIAGCQNPNAQITDMMRSIRSKNLEDRKNIYIEFRIKNQLNWYTKKAKWNSRRAFVWLSLGTAMQAMATIAAILLASNHNWKINLVPLFTTLAMVFISWANVKKHDELSDSYAIAAQELLSALSLSIYIDKDAELCTYVNDAERIISREHTMWVSRKDSFS